ncbi:MAG: ABC transporter permease subunit [Kiritimatiellae bacterium]|jgi:microcin C transport system permease protein|nr:ABC transporter permease subunit [Kiritimatiellia bacterium]
MSWLAPATRERLRRFRRMRRAWISLWILMTLFVLSLLSELIAHGTPWLLRYEGGFYFPRVQNLAQDLFYDNGVHSEPDFHRLEGTEAFAERAGNWMLWAPIRISPHNTISPDRIVLKDELRVLRIRSQRVAELRVNAANSIRTGRGSEWFVGEDPEFPARIQKALEARFQNEPSDDMEVEDASGRFTWTLSGYTPRDSAPRSVRLILRENTAEAQRPRPFVIAGESEERPEWWAALPDSVHQRAEKALIEARTVPVNAISYTDGEGKAWEIRLDKETVQFPFRPVKNHPFGLDQSGRDVLVLILYATRISLLFGFILVFCSMLLGTVLGGIQGYFGGRVDLISQRLIEIYSSIPFLYAMMYMVSVFGRSVGLLLFVYANFNWIGISYYMRAEFLKLRKQPFTEAAHSLGLPTSRIMWKHILPNALVPLITFFPFSLVGAIGSLSALDYIGFGLPVGTPSWGDLLNQAQTYRYAWWLIVYPALTLFLVILLGVFIGEGLRTAFDPKRETHWEA